MNEDYLIHYGVLGMKWGIRKARKRGTKYTYKSHATKVYEKRALNAKTPEARKKNSTFAKNSRILDKKYLDYAKQAKIGKTVLANILARDFGRTYQQLKALDVSRGSVILEGLLFPQAGSIEVANFIVKGKTSYKKKS